MDAGEVVRRAEEADLRLVRFLWCGNDGTVRAKASSGRTGSRAGFATRDRPDGRDAGDEQPRPAAAGRRDGPGRRVPARPRPRRRSACCRTRRGPGAMLVDHVRLDGEPAPVCQRSFLKRMEARLAERGARLEVAFENEFSLATAVDGALRAGRLRPLLLDDRHDRGAGLRRRARRRARTRRGSRLEQYYAELGHGQQEISTAARAGAAGRRRAAARPRDDPRRRVAARARRVARAEAVARERRQRRPHPLLALGGEARGTASTTRRRRTGSRPRRAPSSPACSSTCPGCAG